MSVQARVNNLLGGLSNQITVTCASTGQTIAIPDNAAWITLNPTAATTFGTGTTIPVFSVPSFARNRLVYFHNPSSSYDVTFINRNDTTAAGYADLGGSDRVLSQNDILCLYIKADGAAVMVSLTNN